MELGDDFVDSRASLANELILNQFCALSWHEFRAELQSLDEGDVCRAVHVEWQDFLVENAMGLLRIARLLPSFDGCFIQVKVLQAEGQGSGEPLLRQV